MIKNFTVNDIYMSFIKRLCDKNVDIPFIKSGPNKHLCDFKDSLKDGLSFVHAFKETINEYFPEVKDNESHK